MVTKLSETVLDTNSERQFKQDLSTTTGLTFGYIGGSIPGALGRVVIPDGTLVLPDATVNIVYINTATDIIESAASGAEPTANALRLFSVTTSGGAITAVVDQRARVTQQLD